MIPFTWILSLLLLVASTDKPAYRLYTGEGDVVRYTEMLEALSQADIVLFGEQHNNPVVHWLQYEVTKDLLALGDRSLILGAEMFEADIQGVLNEYLAGHITETHFIKDSRAWDNYNTDYRPLVELARHHGLPFVATNIPRRYAALVARQGMDTLQHLEPPAKAWIAPLPVEIDLSLPGYRRMIEMTGHGHGGVDPENLARAQAIKDATMAHFIIENHKPGHLFIHYNGTYHSNNGEGIVWYLNKRSEDLQVVTISTVEANDTGTLPEGEKGLADFVILTPATMTKTH